MLELPSSEAERVSESRSLVIADSSGASSWWSLRKRNIFLALSCFLLFLLLLSSLSSFGYYVSPHSLVTGSMVTVGVAPDLLRSDGFNTLFVSSVIISSNNRSQSGPYQLNYSFYKTSCDDILESCSQYTTSRSCSNVSGCNYDYGNTGVFSGTIDNGILTYITNINSSLLMEPCAFKLYLFDDKDKYNKFLDTKADSSGYIKESQCLPGIINASVVTNTTTFLLKKSLYYYVAALTFDENLIKNNITISSYTCSYKVSGLQREACSITDTVSSCTVRISESVPTRKEQMCILAYQKESISLTLNYSTTPTGFSNIGSILSFTFSGILLFACLFTGVTGLIYLKCCRKSLLKKELSSLPSKNPFAGYESTRV